MSYIGKQPVVGNFQKCDAISVVNGQAAYSLTVGSAAVTPENANHMLVSLNGVLQAPGDSFTVSGSTLTFASNLATGDVIDFVIILGDVLDLGTPSDNSISTAKLVANSVTAAKFNADVISGQTALAEAPADTDEFLVSDAGVLKRIDYSLIKASDPTHVKLATATISSAVSSINLTGMDSTYQNYMVEIDNVTVQTDETQFSLRFIQGGSTVDTSSYNSQVSRHGIAEGTINTEEANNANKAMIAFGVANDNDQQLNGRMFIYNAPSSDAHTSFNAEISLQHRDNHDHQKHDSHGEIHNNTASTGITFLMSSGNLTAGTFRLYGIA